MELDPGSDEAKRIYLELARRFQDGDGVEEDPEEANYWFSQAGVNNPVQPDEPEAVCTAPTESPSPIDIAEYLRMTPFRKRRAYQAGEPGGMYSYALYLDQNDGRQEAHAILLELVQLLEQPQWEGVGDTLLAMTKTVMGQFYADPGFDDADEDQARNCLEEAALELGYLAAFPDLVDLYEDMDELDSHKDKLLVKLSRIRPANAQDLLTMADIFQRLDRDAFAAACYQGVFAQEQATQDNIQKAQAQLEQLEIQDTDLWSLWNRACRNEPEAMYRFARAAEKIGDFETELQLLIDYMALEEDGKVTDPAVTAQVCAELAQFCDGAESLRYAQKGAQLGSQSCRWLLFTMYASADSVHYNAVKASRILEEYGDYGTSAEKLAVAEKYEELQNPALAKIWYQEALAQRDDPYIISLAYSRLCILNGTDEENRPVTQAALREMANQADRAAALALVHILLSGKLPLTSELDEAQYLLEQMTQATGNPQWDTCIEQYHSRIDELRLQRRTQEEQEERDRLAAIAQKEMERRIQEEKEAKERLAAQKKQERLERQRLTRQATHLAKQQQKELAAKEALLKAQKDQFMKERKGLLLKREEYRLRKDDPMINAILTRDRK